MLNYYGVFFHKFSLFFLKNEFNSNGVQLGLFCLECELH